MKVRKKAWHYRCFLLLNPYAPIPDNRCSYIATIGGTLVALVCAAIGALLITFLYVVGVITIIFGLLTGAEFLNPQFALEQVIAIVITVSMLLISAEMAIKSRIECGEHSTMLRDSKWRRCWRRIKDKACTPLEVVDD